MGSTPSLPDNTPRATQVGTDEDKSPIYRNVASKDNLHATFDDSVKTLFDNFQ